MHRAVRPGKALGPLSKLGTIGVDAAVADDIAAIVDGGCVAGASAGKRAEVEHQTVSIEKCVSDSRRCRRRADDVSQIVDAGGCAGGSAQRAQIRN